MAFNVGDFDDMAEAALMAAMAGRNVFVEGRTVRPGNPGERGKLANTAGVFAFVIDRDADTGKAGIRINGDASVVVETSPGNTHEWLIPRACAQRSRGKVVWRYDP